MKSFNLTEWALNHKQFVYYFIFITFIGGCFSYQNLGRMEDPDFTIRMMIVGVTWPGASAREVEEQVTDKIEKKLQEIPHLDYLKSYSTPGQSVIYVALKEDEVHASQIHPIWLEVRNMVNDIKGTLPQGVVGPFFNDRFDDVFGCVYALTGDGFTYEDIRENAEKIRRSLLSISNIKKVELIGVQPEKITIEVENSKLALLGIDPALIARSVEAQNAMSPSGEMETSSDKVYLRTTGMFEKLEDLQSLPIRAGGRTFRLGDIAGIKRGYADPPEPKMFYNGRPAIGLAVSMEKGGNILTLGENIEQILKRVKKDLPLGLELSTVSNQPQVVKAAINEFIKVLAEAVAIVLIVCFLSLGLRSGIVVAFCIPLVICGVFIAMKMLGIDLHKISLGALIIALGLLVDDAIIAVEMMSVKLEEGWDRFDAASFAYKATAFPLLTGTLITCAGFIPVAFAKGSASEFLNSLFSVVTIALLISWVVAETATPMIGAALIKSKRTHAGQDHDIYNTIFYRFFKKILTWCLIHRWWVIGVATACFIGSIFLMGMVKQEFFPASTRPEVIVELRLPEGASLVATEKQAHRFSEFIAKDPDIVQYSYYIGQGAPRFVLTAEPILPNTNFAQFIVLAKDFDARNRLEKKAKKIFAAHFTNVRGITKVINTGPSDAYPVMLRVSGSDHQKVREIAGQVSDIMAVDKNLRDINLDWNEKNKVMHVEVDQDKARIMGIDSRALSLNLQTLLSGAPIAEFRENDKTISILLRSDTKDRNDLSRLKDLNIHIGGGRFIPLDQIAKISYDAEDGLIWRRNLKPTITVQASTIPGVMGNDATLKVYKNMSNLRKSLPQGYSIDIGGAMELSINATRWLLEPVPAMILVIMTLLMIQLQSISKMVLTLLTAPMGLIGVSLGLLLTGRPMGMVVQFGILALSGIIMRNTVILIDQIDQQLKAGQSVWNSIINATVLRFRPIMLTAAAAILAMFPIFFSEFWGPMAVAIGGGLFGATVMTLLVLPAIYAVWYKARPEEKAPALTL
ncbi:MAG: efflux RND transporter permease subunit [Proteobacteria bacterium]|nr:efflux RND transporter permease subunit [Pseudomonadota bacterium]